MADHEQRISELEEQRDAGNDYGPAEARELAQLYAVRRAVSRGELPQPEHAVPEPAYYRNVIQIEVLSDRPLNGEDDLAAIAYEISEGGSSGMTITVIADEKVSAERMAELLTAQGSDPSFLIPGYDDQESEN